MDKALPAPTLRFMLQNPAHLIALGFGSGLAPFAPGTFGTIFGWLTFNVLQWYVTPLAWLALILVGFGVGIWACDKTGQALGVADHGGMVWDEIIAIWLVLLYTPSGWLFQAIAFVLFRAFDIIKPAPIRWVERRYKGGFGVMIDDICAAIYAVLLMKLGLYLIPLFSGKL